MDKIICLIGASASGKTTLAKELEKVGYNMIHSYTTRKPRYEDEWGHIFVDTEYYLKESKENIIAYNELYNHQYWATKQQYSNKGISIYVIDPQGAKELKDTIKDAEIISIFLSADEITRKTRMLAEDRNDFFKRIEKDKKLFNLVKTDYVIDANRNIKEILDDVLSVIQNLKN
ncbi:putative guanylate kinase [Gottschalkia purinilytica]|uniref:Putative guanylate kinase n=1 Tax=Gottschalkia purinilytica TaxID=1503 RepID=A0A0L0WBM7_GOTPU|nr:AAA family ATPase [Gottschalkia purinilytica]KNF08934.1 putative guanylate kinase [Gottschalkia purinilytica]